MNEQTTADIATMEIQNAPFTWKTLVAISNTEFVPKDLRGKPEAMLACVLMGREVGLGPLQSLQMIDNIDGRPSMSAELLNAMIRAQGHSIQIVEMSSEGVTLRGKRCDNGDEATFTFGPAEAARAGLSSKTNYTRYPESMFLARALSMLARFLFPDVVAAFHAYIPEEVGGEPTPSEIASTTSSIIAQDATIDFDEFDDVDTSVLGRPKKEVEG